MLQIIDTFAEFMAFWSQSQDRPLAEQMKGWESQYIHKWPELWQKQVDCYAEDSEDWQAMAREHVFPFLSQRLPAMQTAHE